MIPLAFANAGILAALVALPVIWYFLRLTPPQPEQKVFPPMRLLLDIAPKEEEPARSPWWLTALRLAAIAAVILALAGPVLSPDDESLPGDGGPLLLVVDNGWGAATTWDDLVETARGVIERAGEAGRPIALLATAEPASQSAEPTDTGAVTRRLDALEPRPWDPDLGVLATKLAAAGPSVYGGAVLVMSGQTGSGVDAFADALRSSVSGAVTTYLDGGTQLSALAPPVNTAEALTAPVIRADGGTEAQGFVRARDISGRVIGEAPYTFAAGETQTDAVFDIPAELRNEIVRLEMADVASAGAVHLIDDRWRRRRIGLVTGESVERAQPLLSPLYYISRAVSPFADVREPHEANAAVAIDQLIEAGVSLIAIADIGTLPVDAQKDVEAWVRAGGTLVRFAGPRLAAQADSLIPVDLRGGDRVLGGSMSWETPQALASFAETSPFAGMPVPDDVTVSRQVLAEPDGALADRTWAALADGTPLVTAAPLGRGTLILFHVTADTTWSNLPLAGAFVDMLRRIIAFSNNVGDTQAGSEAQPAPPFRLLDGYGRFTAPGARVQPIAAAADNVTIGPENPPGLYGSEEGFVALNLIRDDTTLARFDPAIVSDNAVRPFPSRTPVNLAPWLLALTLLLLVADTVIVLALNGGLRLVGGRMRGGATAAALAVLALSALAVQGQPVRADELADQMAMRAANTTRLAYVVTGNLDVDRVSHAGLLGLSRMLAERTSLEPGEPMGVDPARDELAFFPLIYWPVTTDTPLPAATTMDRVGAYMRQGGSVVFDTRDQLERTTSAGSLVGTPAAARLQDMLAGLDIPPLEPVPPDHVLTKTFYLLNEFPGRYAGGPLWVEALPDVGDPSPRPARAGDGVSSIMITSNDFAGAWAVNDNGQFLFPTVPPDRRQREMSLRAGVNIVMYTLTGNYKADQVHVPALLERLGQ